MGVIVARLTGAPDPRTVGSGRTGGTNALRAMGLRRAVAVAGLDVLKGALPVAVAVLLGAAPLIVSLVGVAAVLGSWASIFLRFHGGRGVATGIGAALVIAAFVWIGWNHPSALLFAIVGAALVWIAHRDNIDRLVKGEERKFDPFARGQG